MKDKTLVNISLMWLFIGPILFLMAVASRIESMFIYNMQIYAAVISGGIGLFGGILTLLGLKLTSKIKPFARLILEIAAWAQLLNWTGYILMGIYSTAMSLTPSLINYGLIILDIILMPLLHLPVWMPFAIMVWYLRDYNNSNWNLPLLGKVAAFLKDKK